MHCVREICRTLYQYGVDLPAILGFLVGTFLAYFPGHRFVGALFERRRSIVKTRMEADLEKTLKRDTADYKSKVEEEVETFERELDLENAVVIGKWERALYVYSVMFNQFSLLSGWLVMKAFFGWLGTKEQEREQERARWRMRKYHLYLYGNVWSLIVGLGCGAIGRAVAYGLGSWLTFSPEYVRYYHLP
jgi:hypothetical protein